MVKVGDKIAVMRSSFEGYSILPKEVAKVRKDGRFFLKARDGSTEEQMWSPDKYHDNRFHRSGSDGQRYTREWAEVWSAAHDQHEAARIERSNFHQLKAKVLAKVQALGTDDTGTMSRLARHLGITAE